MTEASYRQVVDSLKGVLKSGAFSDLVITCGSDTYKVHKVIVCGRADFFARAVKFGGRETEESIIDLPEDEPAMIKLLVQYLYEGEYNPLLPSHGSTGTVGNNAPKPDRPYQNPNGYAYTYNFPHTCQNPGYCNQPYVCPHHSCDRMGYGEPMTCNSQCQKFECEKCNPPPLPALNGTFKQLLVHAKMYEMADKYDVVGLKELAREKFDRSCQYFWDSTVFCIAANHAFSTTPEDDAGLRQVISATISAHMELIEKPEVKVLLTQFNGLALGILEEKIKEHGWGKKKD